VTTAARESGTVVASHGRHHRVELAENDEIDCTTRGRRSDIACGDRVQIMRSGGGTAVIESVEPRTTLFYRSDARRQKLIAANVTQVAVVVAADPPFYDDLVNRCLAGAEHANIPALIALNKFDLPEAEAALKRLRLYERLGYPVVTLAAKYDTAPLLPHLREHVTLLVGQSGMGKSTLINALVPGAAARVGEVSVALASGKHTTTHAELYKLDATTRIIDSPGLQEFGLHHLTPYDVAHAFVEFRAFIDKCRFNDCLHLMEPDCAIAGAAADGAISHHRLESYRRLARELTAHPAWK
jgi:ribosome biogenesis GTPase / thiamine phosphate phosphatase